MFHSRCDAMIHLLKLELENSRAMLKAEQDRNREETEKLLQYLANRQGPAPIMMQRPPPSDGREDLKLEDLPPEMFDAENALYIGRDVVPDTWIPRHFHGKVPKEPKTAAGQDLKQHFVGQHAFVDDPKESEPS